MVVALLALFLALGGTSYAAVRITGKNVKDSSLTSKDVKNGSLLKKDFKRGQLPKGTTGARGATGATGTSGVTSFSEVNGADVSVAPGEVGSAQAACPAGTAPSGTGFDGNIGNVGFARRFGQFVGVGVYNDTSITIQVSAQAICAAGAGARVASAHTDSGDKARFARAIAELNASPK